MLNIILAEDHNVVRNGIRMLLETEPDFRVAGEAGNGLEVLKLLTGGLAADIVLADINMPEMDGMALLRSLKLQYPGIRVMILSMHDHEKYVTGAFSEGAFGYLLKNVTADELIFSVKRISEGHKYLCTEIAFKLLGLLTKSPAVPFARDETILITAREAEVLEAIAAGLTNTEIAEKLFLSKRTIEGHRQALLEKTGSKNTAALIRYAVLHGLVA